MLPPDRLPPARVRKRRPPAALAPSSEAASSLPPPASAALPAPASTMPSPTGEVEEPAYEVGYRKPPVHSRFKPGQSGNPKGRPKGAKTVSKMVTDLMDERITINLPSGPRRVPRIEVLLRKLIELGVKGNARAIDQVFRYYLQARAEGAVAALSSPDDIGADATPADEASLALLQAMLVAGLAQEEARAP